MNLKGLRLPLSSEQIISTFIIKNPNQITPMHRILSTIFRLSSNKSELKAGHTSTFTNDNICFVLPTLHSI